MDSTFSATVLQGRSELFMKRHIATALLVGMGIAVERPQFGTRELLQRNASSPRVEIGLGPAALLGEDRAWRA